MSGFRFESDEALAIIITPLAVGVLCLALVLYRRHRRLNAGGIVQPLVRTDGLQLQPQVHFGFSRT